MPMPETTVDENDFFSTGENNIRFPRKVISVKAKAIAKSMKERTND